MTLPVSACYRASCFVPAWFIALMSRLRVHLLLLVLLCAGPIAGQAQPPVIDPGLWEMQIRSPEFDAMRATLDENLARMPPSLREQALQLMAGQGLALSEEGVRACITPEQARRGPELIATEMGCTHDLQWDGKLGRYHMRCKDGREGSGEITFSSARSWHGWGEFSYPARRSKLMRVDYQGRWLGADCGEVAPIRTH